MHINWAWKIRWVCLIVLSCLVVVVVVVSLCLAFGCSSKFYSGFLCNYAAFGFSNLFSHWTFHKAGDHQASSGAISLKGKQLLAVNCSLSFLFFSLFKQLLSPKYLSSVFYQIAFQPIWFWLFPQSPSGLVLCNMPSSANLSQWYKTGIKLCVMSCLSE